MAKPARPEKLEEDVNFTIYGSWKYIIIANIRRNKDYAPFIGAEWQKVTPNNPNRGLVSDEGANGLSAEEKVINLENMLGFVAQYVPHFLSYDIINSSTSLDSVWQFIRKYYGFKQSESQFMKYSEIEWEKGERPERLYQRLVAHIQDNLLTRESTMTYHGARITDNEIISPTLERLIVLQWMQLIHPRLPSLVQRTFAFQLQEKSLADLQPSICDNIDAFLAELQADEEFKSARSKLEEEIAEITISRSQSRPEKSSSRSMSTPSRGKQFYPGRKSYTFKPQGQKSCRICKAEGRNYLGHTLPECDFLSNADKKGLIPIRATHVDDEDELDPSDWPAIDPPDF